MSIIVKSIFKVNNNPLISVCIPNYNNAKYVGEALQSALQQTYQNIEVVVCDNCSTDDSWNVIQKFDSPKLKKYRNTNNIGMVGNFQKVLELAKGEYITFLCSDDSLYKNAIATAVQIHNSNEGLGFVFGSIDFAGSRKGTYSYNDKNKLFEPFEYIKASLRRAGNLTYLTGTVLKRSVVVDNIKDFVFFDWLLYLIINRQHRAYYTVEKFGIHRYHPHNVTVIEATSVAKNYDLLDDVLVFYSDKYGKTILTEFSRVRLAKKYYSVIYLNGGNISAINELTKEKRIKLQFLFRFTLFLKKVYSKLLKKAKAS